MTAVERVRSVLLDRGWLLALVALVAYAWLAPAHIVDGDNAEFATLGTIGGAAHPSGYPLYLMILRAMQWLPADSPAHVAALATAVIAAAGVLVLHAACRAWGARPVAATLAVAIFAGAPVVVRFATEAEVFALNNLIVALVLWLSAARGPLRGSTRVLVLGVVAGLGLANHMTCVLVAPLGLHGAIRGVRESDRALRAVAAGIGGLAVGLAPYAYLLVTPDTPLSWGKIDDIGELIAHVLREDYGGPVAFMPSPHEPSFIDQLRALASTLGRTWLYLGAIAGIAMLAWRTVRPAPDGEGRAAWRLLAVSFVLAGPALVARFNVAPEGLGLYVVQRFHLLPAVLLVVPVSVALAPLDVVLARRNRGALGCAVAATGAFATSLALSLPHLQRVHTPAVEQYVRNLLHALPRDAVVFAGSDAEYLGMGYVQWALGERTDVVVVAAQLTAAAWYQDRIAARGVVAGPGDELPIIRVIDRLHAQGRPVFADASRTELFGVYPTYPYATVLRVLPRGTQLPALEAVVAENESLYKDFRFGYPLPGPDAEFATLVHRRYAATWTTLGRLLEGQGQPRAAARAYAIAAEVGPR